METAEILKRVRKIEIKTRGLSNQIFSGEYHSAFKGRGMAFSEVREYMPGDEIRTIDWNVTARFNHPYVKVFEEEREISMMLLIDMSGSNAFGTNEQLKSQLITEVAAVLAFSAIQNNDKVGAILFTDQVEKFIPPKKGKSHILRIIRELVDFQPQSTKTNIEAALSYLASVNKKRSIVFLLSDFYDTGYEKSLSIANRKHDLVALQVKDQREEELPNIGLIRLKDPETGKMIWVNTGSKKVRQQYHINGLKHDNHLRQLFMKSGVDYAQLHTGTDYIRPLMNLFKRRELR